MLPIRVMLPILGVFLLIPAAAAAGPPDGRPANVKERLLQRMEEDGATSSPVLRTRDLPLDPVTGAPLPGPLAAGDEHWAGGYHLAGLDGPVARLLVLDGELYVGGGFRASGNTALNGIARRDGADWFPLGSGMNDWVTALGGFHGDPVAGGDFTRAGGTNAESIARWDGAAWQPLGEGLQGSATAWVTALAEFDGDLYVGGYFETAGGQPAQNVARWDGTAWHPVGKGLNSSVLALEVWNGALYAAGAFTASGDEGQALNHMARLEDGAWKPVGDGLDDWVRTLTVHDGELVAGGDFTGSALSTLRRVARWNGTRWAGLGAGLDRTVWDLLDVDGELWAVGDFTNHIVAFASGFWFTRGANVNDLAVALASRDEGVVVGGYFTLSNLTPASFVIQEFEGTWIPLQSSTGSGFSAPVYDMVVWRGNLVVGGDFVVAGDKIVRFLARWDGQEWQEIPGVSGLGVRSLHVFGNDLVISGYFESAGGNDALGIARWDGQTWRAMGDGFNGAALSMVEFEGHLYAGGQFSRSGDRWLGWVGKFDGGVWQPLEQGVVRDVFDLTVYDGLLYVGGNFHQVPGHDGMQFLGAWDGTHWQHVADVDGPVGALGVHQEKLIVAGTFSTLNGIPAQSIVGYDGTSWEPLGNGVGNGIYALTELNGDLIAAGKLTPNGGPRLNHLARWDGTAWSSMGSGLDNDVFCLLPDSNRLYVGGAFTLAGGKPSMFIARWDEEVTPVRLASFTARREGAAAVVEWRVAGSAADYAGFHVHREGPAGDRLRLTRELLSGFESYAYRDENAPWGRARYWLEEVSRNGESSWHGPVALEAAIAPAPTLAQVRPNPFRASAHLSGVNPVAGRVTLRVFDASGREAARPWDAALPEGAFELAWDGRGGAGEVAPAGVYYLRLDTPAGSVTRKLVKVP